MAEAQWEFEGTADGTWTWHFGGGAVSGPFSNLDAAFANATSHGFDPFTNPWSATKDGRTTHYRAGMTPINLPSGMPLPK